MLVYWSYRPRLKLQIIYDILKKELTFGHLFILWATRAVTNYF